ncbi:uncharacterized protein BDZ99DRAFT_465419 [Mytilinidion resinicola]|uniref:C3H1-type domain-containing protein n=1 Tax=Mytilinidion resinicola TaxID=574789 RepID=A0A6A6YCT2_9PEZI|nr:uncharacterized protein BDZ99DRAFT_465419 [Mytilinidion resinicola]KAF2806622.1 hypothetical protein BDZ99DRAFT_465419 [Mytilinidion resinicola]
MTDTAELEAKIAALAGRINLHKQQEQGQPQSPPRPATGMDFVHPSTSPRDAILTGGEGYGRGRGRGRGGPNWAPQRGSPYAYPRGRVAKFPYSTHRNRTLVLNGNPATPPNGGAQQMDAVDSNTWVAKNDRHMQLINTSVYDQISKERARSMANTTASKQSEQDAREKARLSNHFEGISRRPSHGVARKPTDIPELLIGTTRFQVADGGSKLLRLSRDPTQLTPKRHTIAGVMFVRSKNGNLYRSGLVKGKKRREVLKVDELCPRFTPTGSCARGPTCRFVHDIDKLAICKEFLTKGKCALGDGCELSHTPTPNRVPACLHFVRGNCTNDKCRYAHVRINPTAPVCRAFGRLGYCDKGADCPDRHMFECPDYANKGMCRNAKCRLLHVDRASQLRSKAAAADSLAASEDDDYQDISSDEEVFGDSDDFDSEGLDDDSDIIGHGLSQQEDYVRI